MEGEIMKTIKKTLLLLSIGAMMMQSPVQAKDSPMGKALRLPGEFIQWGIEGIGMAAWDASKFVNRRLGNKPLVALAGVAAFTIAVAPQTGADLVKQAFIQSVSNAYSCSNFPRAFLLLTAGYCYKSYKQA
jgi:hypothetical protein